MADWAGKRVTILGMGRSGLSSAGYLARLNASVFVSDSQEPNAKAAAEVEKLKALSVQVETGGHSDKALAQAELIVASPGIRPGSEVMKRVTKLGKEVVSDIEIAFRDSRVPMIAVTGTNGKSTTCALISYLLESSGLRAPACGNIGVPILDKLEGNPDFLVVEISSFQITYSPTLAPKIALWLNLTPDHIEWHGGLESYIEAKRKLFSKQGKDQFAVINMDDEIVKDTKYGATIFPFSMKSCLEEYANAAYLRGSSLCLRLNGKEHVVAETGELKIRGRHNWENALAAIACTCLAGLAVCDISRHIKTFRALEHRLEFVDTILGVDFYNDSKATNPVSAVKALESFDSEKVVLIAGGRDKGTELDEFVQAAKLHATNVILIGEAADRFAKAFASGGFAKIERAKNLEEAVELGLKLKAGPVLLSPACASFDMFTDYEERGRVFKDIVRTRCKGLAPSH